MIKTAVYLLTAIDQKLEKVIKRWYYSASRWHLDDVMVGTITFYELQFLIHMAVNKIDKLQFLPHDAMLARYMPSSCVCHTPVLYQNNATR